MKRPRTSSLAMWLALALVAAVLTYIIVAGYQVKQAEDAEDAARDRRLNAAVASLNGAREEREMLKRLVESLELNLRESNRRLRQAGAPVVPVPDAGQVDEPERQDSELQEPERQEPERQDAENQDPERADAERQDVERQDSETQDEEQQDAEEQESEQQEAEQQDAEVDDPDPNDPDPDDPEVQDEERDDPDPDDPESDDPDPDTANPPATLTFNFAPPIGTVTCTRSGGSDENPTYDC